MAGDMVSGHEASSRLVKKLKYETNGIFLGVFLQEIALRKTDNMYLPTTFCPEGRLMRGEREREDIITFITQ